MRSRPNGEVSEAATFQAFDPTFRIEAFLGQRQDQPGTDPVDAILSDVQCNLSNAGQYWGCPGPADQYTLEAIACENRSHVCTP